MIGKAILIAIALSVDSMAVSLSGSVSMGRLDWKKVGTVALILATVQTFLLSAGYFAGEGISMFVSKYGPWIGFSLLLYVGIGMIVEAFKCEERKDFGSTWKIIVSAVATSIDAMATGGSFGLCCMPLVEICLIAAFTFLATALFAVLGMVCGCKIGERFGKSAKIIAGIVLILIGVQIILA